MSGNAAKPPPGNRSPEPREMTRLETDDEIRQALEVRRARLAGKAPAKRQLAAEPATVEPETQAYRPLQRPPLTKLCILDDGRHDGEWVRLRGDRCVIGRDEGDIRIPYDGMMSGRHAELTRHRIPDGFRWFLTDLQSTNGTFVRVGSTILRHQDELNIGLGHYRLEVPGSAPPEESAATPRQATRSWQEGSVRSLVPSLVELTAAGPGPRFPLTLPEYWIGRDPKACPIARPDDLLVNPRHARLYRDAKGQWHIENHKSLNGVWLRIDQLPLGTGCHFQLGEQRFLLRVLS